MSVRISKLFWWVNFIFQHCFAQLAPKYRSWHLHSTRRGIKDVRRSVNCIPSNSSHRWRTSICGRIKVSTGLALEWTRAYVMVAMQSNVTMNNDNNPACVAFAVCRTFSAFYEKFKLPCFDCWLKHWPAARSPWCSQSLVRVHAWPRRSEINEFQFFSFSISFEYY